MLVAALDDAALADAMQNRGQEDLGLTDAVRRDEESLEALSTDFYADKLITREEFFAARQAIQKRLEGNRGKLTRRNGHSVLAGFIGEGSTLRNAWENGSLDWRRAVVGALLERVVIGPGRAGRNAVDPERVKPVWRY